MPETTNIVDAVEQSTTFDMGRLIEFFSEDRVCKISFGAWNGRPQLTVFRGAGLKPLSQQITGYMKNAIKIVCKLLLKTPAPGSKYSIRTSTYDKDNKTWTIKTVLICGIDDNGIYYLEYKDVTAGPSCKFPVKGTSSIEIGTENETAASKSKLMFETFYQTLDDLTVAAMFTRNHLKKYERPGGTGAPAQQPAAQRTDTTASAAMSNGDLY